MRRRVCRASVGLSREGAAGITNHINAIRGRAHAAAEFRLGRAELAGPQFVAIEVVLTHLSVNATRVGLSRKDAAGTPNHIHTLSGRAHAEAVIVLGRAELAGPQFIAIELV